MGPAEIPSNGAPAMKPGKLVARLGPAERPLNGVSIREIAYLSCVWDPQSPLSTGAIPVGISELAMPSGPAGRPSDAHLGGINKLALRMWAAEPPDSGVTPIATSKLVAPVSKLVAPRQRCLPDRN